MMVRIVAIVLIVLGVIGLAYGGITWTRDRTVVDIGPLEVQAQERETIPLPPVVGGICLVAGIALLVVRR
ncbi:MAG: DUF3185 domain-containing protein [Vicinamibacterales bacterium]